MCVCAHVSMCVVALLHVRRLGSVELQANELLHALPVLHLGGAVGGVLTCGTVALRLSHLLVHLGQPQPVGEGGEHNVGHDDMGIGSTVGKWFPTWAPRNLKGSVSRVQGESSLLRYTQTNQKKI